MEWPAPIQFNSFQLQLIMSLNFWEQMNLDPIPTHSIALSATHRETIVKCCSSVSKTENRELSFVVKMGKLLIEVADKNINFTGISLIRPSVFAKLVHLPLSLTQHQQYY